jgi:cysteine synthase
MVQAEISPFSQFQLYERRGKMSTVDQTLLNHPIWAATDPNRSRLVRISAPLPDAFNPFAADGVVLLPAGVPGEIKHSKAYVGREGILNGVLSGKIQQDTIVDEATSGNTGQAMAEICNALGLNFAPIVGGDVPGEKINALRIFAPFVNPQIHNSTTESTVERARRMGALPGHYNPDQYAGKWNPEAHCAYLAPQLFNRENYYHSVGSIEGPSLVVVPGGTMGTGMGLAQYLRDSDTRVVATLCEEGEEVPGARSEKKIRRDIRLPWEDYFTAENIEYGPRHESFLLSYRSWQAAPQMLGPSFGLAYYGALRHLWRHKRAGTLDQFRKDGKIYVVIFGPDDNRPYLALYFGELKEEQLNSRDPIRLSDMPFFRDG